MGRDASLYRVTSVLMHCRDRIQSVLQNRRINMQFLLWAKEKRASRDSLMEEFNTHLQSQEGTIDGMSV